MGSAISQSIGIWKRLITVVLLPWCRIVTQFLQASGTSPPPKGRYRSVLLRALRVPLEAVCILVVMHSSDSSRSRPQDIRLAVPPDLAYDSFPLLQSLRPFQLLGRSKYVHAQRPVRLAAVIADGDFCAGQRDGRLGVVPVFVVVVLALPVLLADVLQVLFLGRGGGHVGARLAGDADDQEAERQHQAETHAEHKVKAEALWVGWGENNRDSIFILHIPRWMCATLLSLMSFFIFLLFIPILLRIVCTHVRWELRVNGVKFRVCVHTHGQ